MPCRSQASLLRYPAGGKSDRSVVSLEALWVRDIWGEMEESLHFARAQFPIEDADFVDAALEGRSRKAADRKRRIVDGVGQPPEENYLVAFLAIEVGGHPNPVSVQLAKRAGQVMPMTAQ